MWEDSKDLCLRQTTILYAEDDRETQNILAMILEDYVDKLILAKDGLEAWKIFKENKVDLVLTDILMPNLNGIELAKRIRSHNDKKNTPIIIATAFTETHYLLDSIKLKCDGYVLKPLILDDLLETLYGAVLPRIQQKEIELKNQLLETLNIIFGGKKVEIVKYLIENSNHNKIFDGTHEDISEKLNISRQTVIKCFQQLINFGLLQKLKNRKYRLCSKEEIESFRLNKEYEQNDNIQKNDILQ